MGEPSREAWECVDMVRKEAKRLDLGCALDELARRMEEGR